MEDERAERIGDVSVELELRGAGDDIESLASSFSNEGAGCKVSVGVLWS
jgi:hypothetical protein